MYQYYFKFQLVLFSLKFGIIYLLFDA